MEAFHLEPFWFTLLHSGDLRELWHPELELVFLLQGTGRVYFSDLKTTYTLREKDIFAVNSFEVQSFELDEDAAALSFWVTPEFVGNVAPELLKYRVNCRSFLYVEEKQPAFDVLRQDLARAFQTVNKRDKTGVSFPGALPDILAFPSPATWSCCGCPMPSGCWQGRERFPGSPKKAASPMSTL